MSSDKPTFSIVMPIYNEEKYIKEALDSIVAQTDPDWEALLVDDGSTDATPEILDQYAVNDPRFRVFHKPNGGQSSAINKGVEEARGEWLCWLSGDDFFHPRKLELNRNWIEKYPEKKFFFSGHWLIEPNGNTLDYNLDWLNLENSAYHLITLFRCNYVMGISICVKRESWIRTGGFDGSLRHAHDMDMWLRLMLHTPTQYLPDRTCTMRYHPGQETARFPMAPLFDVAKASIRLINAHPFRDFFPGFNLADPQTAFDCFSRALDFVASEPSCNFYALGYHPALLLRMLEWLWDPSTDPEIAQQLRTAFRAKATAVCEHYKITPFTLMWKAALVAMDQPAPSFVYQPSEPARIGEIHYYGQRAVGSEGAVPLRTYLERYDGMKFNDDQQYISSNHELMIILPDELCVDGTHVIQAQWFEKILQEMIQAGFSVLLVGKSKTTLGMAYGLPILGVEEAGLEPVLKSLHKVDIVINFSGQKIFHWVSANHKIAGSGFSVGTPAREVIKLLVNELQANAAGQPEVNHSEITLENQPIGQPLWKRAIRKAKALFSNR